MRNYQLELEILEIKARSLKTRKAQEKAWDKVQALRFELSEVLSAKYPKGATLPEVRLNVYGIVSGVGAIDSGSQATVLDVYSKEIVVSVPTSEYPNGEVFKVPFADGSIFGKRNLDKLLTII